MLGPYEISQSVVQSSLTIRVISALGQVRIVQVTLPGAEILSDSAADDSRLNFFPAQRLILIECVVFPG